MDGSESTSTSRGTLEDILSHYGKKGMHWGVTTKVNNVINPDRSVSKDVVLKETPGKLVKTSGGQFHPASADARNAAIGRQMIKKSSIDVLSNKELQAVVTRMNLEQQYSNLKKNPRTNQDHVKKFMKEKGLLATVVGVTAFKSDPRVAIPAKIGSAILKAAMATQKLPKEQEKKKKKKQEDED